MKKVEQYGPDAAGRDLRGRHGNHARGERNPRWQGGVSLSSHGYLKIQVGKEHPLADPNGYAYLHQLVMAAAGHDVRGGDSVHHRDGDKLNNRISNLDLLSPSDHAATHDEERGRDEKGRFPAGPTPAGVAS